MELEVGIRRLNGMYYIQSSLENTQLSTFKCRGNKYNAEEVYTWKHTHSLIGQKS